MNKTDYEWYKSKRICPRCRVNDAFENHVFCPECLEKISMGNAKYSHKREEYQKNQNKARRIQYAKRKQAGMCTVCGKNTAQHSVYCNECYLKRMKNRRNTEYQKRDGRKSGDAFRQRMRAGLCMYCGEKQVPGYKFCKSCLEKKQEVGRKIGKQNSENSFMREEVDRQWEKAKLKHLENT